MKVWTRAYRPFILGGDVHAPICCEVEPVGGTHELGKGHLGILVLDPRGRIFVAEVRSGGIVGTSLELVRRDVEEGDEETIRLQIEEDERQASRAVPVPPWEFWSHL